MVRLSPHGKFSLGEAERQPLLPSASLPNSDGYFGERSIPVIDSTHNKEQGNREIPLKREKGTFSHSFRKLEHFLSDL